MSRTTVLPLLLVLSLIAVMLVLGPIHQPAHYHAFADQRTWLGIPHAADVLSNAGFLLAGLYGLWCLHRLPPFPRRRGYYLFFLALLLTCLGSGYYHWAPDNDRLLWDRLPIALACAGLLSAQGPLRWRDHGGVMAGWVVFAVFGVVWWQYTEAQGQGDLRPYLLLQLLPLVLIPLLQWCEGVDWTSRQRFALAVVLYVLAKACELYDGVLFERLGMLSGHTLKHLLAGLAAWVLCWQLDPLAAATALRLKQA